MRLRNVKDAHRRFDSSTRVLRHPEALKGKWQAHFGSTGPLHVEIGMGKGRFIIEHAKSHPERNYVGLEKFTSVLVRALDKLESQEEPLDNLEIARFDAEHITDILGSGEVARLYLNFSDPWPKDRHAKRRLTHVNFLEKYREILAPSGEIVMKTDNVKLFDFTLEMMEAMDMEIKAMTRDLHGSPYAEGNIMTEYEKKFSREGMPIHMVTASFKPEP